MTPALRRGRRLASIPLGVALLAALVFAAQAPAAPDDGFLGAKTDTAASTMCPAGSAVVGLFGRVGTFNPGEYAASIRVSCEGGATAGESIGDGGFTEEQTACPDGHYAVGIEGNEGDFIDRIALRCRPSILGAVEATAGYPSGGFGGSLDGPYDCGSNEMLVGLDGSVSDLNMLSTARHVQPVCASRPVIPAPDDENDGGGSGPGETVPPPPAKVERSLALAYKNGAFNGTLKPAGACAAGEKVKVFEKRKGRDPKVGSDSTSSKGKYSVAENDPDGTFYAQVKESAEAAATCLATRSKRIRLG